MSWTEERVDLLKKRWQEGRSAAEISKELGGISRNSVIGKAHRLHLADRSPPGRLNPKPKPPLSLPGRSSSLPSRSNLTRWLPRDPPVCSFGGAPEPDRARTPTTAQFVLPPPLKKKEKIAVPPPDPSFRCTLVELTPAACRWPIGDPRKQDFRYCGAKKIDDPELSYCPYHEAMARQPLRSRSDESKAAA